MKSRAFSLIETLVVIAIITVLAGLVLTVVVGSKRKALQVDDMSKLRQLGQAGAMYADDHGEYPLSTAQLVSLNMVPPEFSASRKDTVAEGIANRLARWYNKDLGRYASGPVTLYKRTFVGYGEYSLSSKVFSKWVLNGPAAGWLVDATDSEQTPFPTPTQWKGTYKRLTLEGAVITRQHKDYPCTLGGKVQPCRMPGQLFVDDSEYFAELVKSLDRPSSFSAH